MYFRKLGGTGWLTGEIGFVARSGAGRVVPDEATATGMIRHALDRGVSFIDVSPRDGGSVEQLVGRAIAGRREQALIASHAGVGGGAGGLEQQVRASLERLGCEYVDLLQLDHPPASALADPDLWAAIERLQEAGAVQQVGLVADSMEAGLAALEDHRIAVLQVALNAADAELLPLLAAARAAGRGLIVRSPLCGGLLTAPEPSSFGFPGGDPRRDWPDARLESMRVLARRFAALVAAADRSAAQAAIGWVLAHEEVSVVLPAATSPQQLAENLAASDLPLPSPRLLAALQHARLTAIPA
jgi:aryl-alcohol dehydrogenase-like predicted oxidoreductase